MFDDRFLPEIVDPETGEPTDGLGELVLTTLTKEALPVLRYRTGDITRFVDGACACGRTHSRIARFTGRVDDMLIVRGVNVFPSEIEEVIRAPQLWAGRRTVAVRGVNAAYVRLMVWPSCSTKLRPAPSLRACNSGSKSDSASGPT